MSGIDFIAESYQSVSKGSAAFTAAELIALLERAEPDAGVFFDLGEDGGVTETVVPVKIFTVAVKQKRIILGE